MYAGVGAANDMELDAWLLVSLILSDSESMTMTSGKGSFTGFLYIAYEI